ncbi:MAG: hypothetical protein P4L36_21430, partial [Holophaga sp.]|nr:hypothetical protein [Holophaga sp.]
LAALARLGSDRGAALLDAAASGNPYAGAMVRLADPARAADNLVLLGQVAAAAERDAASGATSLDKLLMARALAAVGPVAAFAPGDPACTGPASVLGPGRRRVVLDLYLLSMIDQAERRFGLTATVYRAARGEGGLPGDARAILGNRLNLDPGGPFQEVKAWMAPLRWLAGSRIDSGYRSGAGPVQFPWAGAAVRTRNRSYPSGPASALAAMAQTLRQAP